MQWSLLAQPHSTDNRSRTDSQYSPWFSVPSQGISNVVGWRTGQPCYRSVEALAWPDSPADGLA